MPSLPPVRRKSSARSILAVALLAFLIGGVTVGWLVRGGYLSSVMPMPLATNSAAASDGLVAPNETPLPSQKADPAADIGSVEARLALLEDRLSRIDFQADTASGNAARAEGLLIAFAARRTIDKGEPLGYVADQLRLRFANAQPRAVQTIIEFAQKPVTLDELSARIEALSPELSDTAETESFWSRAGRKVSSLFVIHRDSSALLTPSARIDRAKLMVTSRRIGKAIEEVQRLPNADAAQVWIADAQRLLAAQQALDLIETTAMLEPRRLQDSAGQPVQQPSPLASPASPPLPKVTPRPATSAAPASVN